MVLVLDAWTSPRGSGAERRNVFSAGEELQFNALFDTERRFESEVDIRFVAQSASNVTFVRDSIDLIAQPQAAFSGRFRVGPGVHHPFLTFRVQAVEYPRDFRPRDRLAATNELASASGVLLSLRTLWTYFCLVRLTELSTGQAFDVSETWHYTIQR